MGGSPQRCGYATVSKLKWVHEVNCRTKIGQLRYNLARTEGKETAMSQITLDSPIALSVAKDNFSVLTSLANQLGVPFIVTRNKRPWVEIRPLAVQPSTERGIAIEPLGREIDIPSISRLFEGYKGGHVPCEDGFAGSAGEEEM